MYSKVRMTVIAAAVGGLLVPAFAQNDAGQDQVSSIDTRQNQASSAGSAGQGNNPAMKQSNPSGMDQAGSGNVGVIDAPDPNYTQSMQLLLSSAQKLRESIQHMAQLPEGDRRDDAIRQAHQALFDAHQAMINLPPRHRSELGQKVSGSTQTGQQQTQTGQQQGQTGQQMSGTQQGLTAEQAGAHSQQGSQAGGSGQIYQTLPGTQAGVTHLIIEGESTGQQAQSNFDRLDRDNDGFLSMMEVAADEDSRQIFHRLDRDGDYKLSRSEWGDDTAAVVISYAIAQPVAMTGADQVIQGNAGFGNQGQATSANWNVSNLYQHTWSGREMIGTMVVGDNGTKIGEVKDIVVNENGQVNKVVVEVGGFLEIGDQHIGVPWKSVTVAPGMRWVQVPLKEVEDGTFSLFGRVPQGENVSIAPTSWRVNELIGDVVSLRDVGRNGLVMDVIFNEGGNAVGVVVDRGTDANVGGWYGYPYAGYYPGSYGYPFPFQGYETAAAGRFSYEQLAESSRFASDRNPLAQRQSMLDLRASRSQGLPGVGATGGATGNQQTMTFSSLDRNNDGYLSPLEVAEVSRFQQNFDRFDTNGDNILSRSEWNAAFDRTARLGS